MKSSRIILTTILALIITSCGLLKGGEMRIVNKANIVIIPDNQNINTNSKEIPILEKSKIDGYFLLGYKDTNKKVDIFQALAQARNICSTLGYKGYPLITSKPYEDYIKTKNKMAFLCY